MSLNNNLLHDFLRVRNLSNILNSYGTIQRNTEVTLLFMEAASLKNTNDLLKGEGAKARTYKILKVKDINKKALENWFLNLWN